MIEANRGDARDSSRVRHLHILKPMVIPPRASKFLKLTLRHYLDLSAYGEAFGIARHCRSI